MTSTYQDIIGRAHTLQPPVNRANAPTADSLGPTLTNVGSARNSLVDLDAINNKLQALKTMPSCPPPKQAEPLIVYQSQYKLWNIVLAACSACLGFLFFGYVIVIMNAVLPFYRKFVFREETYGEFIVTFLAAAPVATAAIGALLAGWLSSRIGRRKLMMLVDLVGIGGVILTLVTNFTTILVGRLIMGLTIGITTVAAPLYFTELAPVKYRGEFTNIPNIFSALGILFAALLGLLIPATLRRREVDTTWRTLFALAMIPLILRFLIFTFFFTKETPFYYVNKSRFEDAAKSLTKVYNGDVTERIQQILDERNYIQKSESHTAPFRSIFTKRFRRALWVCSLIMALQYLSGLNLVLVYTGDIYSEGYQARDDYSPQILGILTPFVNLFAAVVSIYFSSQFRRKPLLVWGTFFTGVIGLVYGILARTISADHLLPKIVLVFWPFPWGISLGSIIYVVVSESLPDLGVAFATIWSWVFSFLTLQFYPDIIESMGRGWGFIMLGGITIIGALILSIFLIETRGKNKDEILIEYNGKVMAAQAPEQAEENVMRQAVEKMEAHHEARQAEAEAKKSCLRCGKSECNGECEEIAKLHKEHVKEKAIVHAIEKRASRDRELPGDAQGTTNQGRQTPVEMIL